MNNSLKFFFIGATLIIISSILFKPRVEPNVVLESKKSIEELDSLFRDAKAFLDSSRNFIKKYSCKCVIQQNKDHNTITTKLHCLLDDKIISNYYETVVTSDEPLIKSAVEYIKARTYLQENHPNCLIEYKGF